MFCFVQVCPIVQEKRRLACLRGLRGDNPAAFPMEDLYSPFARINIDTWLSTWDGTSKVMVDITQNPGFTSCSASVPTMTTTGIEFSLSQRRHLLDRERFLVQALPVYPGLSDDFETPWTAALTDISAAERRKCAGNGMNALHLGQVMAYCLANVVVLPQPVTSHLGRGGGNDHDEGRDDHLVYLPFFCDWWGEEGH